MEMMKNRPRLCLAIVTVFLICLSLIIQIYDQNKPVKELLATDVVRAFADKAYISFQRHDDLLKGERRYSFAVGEKKGDLLVGRKDDNPENVVKILSHQFIRISSRPVGVDTGSLAFQITVGDDVHCIVQVTKYEKEDWLVSSNSCSGPEGEVIQDSDLIHKGIRG